MEIGTKAYAYEQLVQTMEANNMTSTELGMLLNISQTYVSKWRHGAMPIRLDYIERMLKALPNQSEFLALDLAHGISKFIPPVANGPKLYGMSLSYASRTIVELKEDVQALVNSLDELQGPADMINGSDDPKEAVYQTFDVVFIALNTLIMICRDYDFDIAEMEANREKVWEKNGLIK